ncbi:MAG: hypothetical protein JKY24_08965, partial [Pseudomonadales bacterium]|nr:hypothetical protein [Pseudomonadales bacterium]
FSISNSERSLFTGGSPSKRKMSFKRKLLWFGVGVIAAGALYSAGASHEKSEDPPEEEVVYVPIVLFY